MISVHEFLSDSTFDYLIILLFDFRFFQLILYLYFTVTITLMFTSLMFVYISIGCKYWPRRRNQKILIFLGGLYGGASTWSDEQAS